MFVKRRGSLFDVFTGKGWDSYSCFELRNGKLLLVSGASVSDHDYKKLLEEVRNVW